MAASKYNDPQYWLDRAAEVRQIAQTFTEETARTQMAEIAERYDRMALFAERLKLFR